MTHLERKRYQKENPQCLITTDFTHLRNVWTGAAHPTLNKRNRIYHSQVHVQRPKCFLATEHLETVKPEKKQSTLPWFNMVTDSLSQFRKENRRLPPYRTEGSRGVPRPRRPGISGMRR